MIEARPSRAATVASWGVGVVFILSGLAKLVSLEPAVSLFSRFNLPHWALYAVGVFEVVAAGLLLYRRTRSLGALALCADMAGATLAHVLTAVEQEMLLLDVGFFGVCAWLLLRDVPAFFRPDWEHDPHRHEEALRAAQGRHQ